MTMTSRRDILKAIPAASLAAIVPAAAATVPETDETRDADLLRLEAQFIGALHWWDRATDVTAAVELEYDAGTSTLARLREAEDAEARCAAVATALAAQIRDTRPKTTVGLMSKLRVFERWNFEDDEIAPAIMADAKAIMGG
ncbi:hypothetical protein FJ970_18075 [Mesorhizobium sp. B2-1-8]|uniref:hypothetical protein n=1 Tax=Mesorhizobium sp. B2-1-8 TaxID=2589967 RepID=UPI0011285D96|nr:hypothetical protein [Mesorhizobium sp. B2-1-8]UCI17041.1 hypothetical protein FJ970_18075 [Mesorhizobium sp. B2-1-8]